MDFASSLGLSASFSQTTDIGSTFWGPTLGAGARFELGNGVFLFGRLGVSLDIHHGRGSWSTIVPLVDGDTARTARLSDNKTGYSLDGTIGAGYRYENFELRASFLARHTNASPFLEFAAPQDQSSGAGGARIGYGKQTDIGGALGARLLF